MNWKNILGTGLLLSSAAFASPQTFVRFDLTDSMKSFLRAHDYDVTGVNYKTMEIEALLTDEQLAVLTANKANFKFSFPQNLSAGLDDAYMTPQKIEDFIRSVHANHPDITEIKSIGKSLEGRDIWAIKISDNVRVDEVEPVVMVNGMHHAREVMTTEVTTDMVDYLTSQYGKIADVTKWVNSYEIWVVPMFNVDGNNKVWTEDSMWRKNVRGGYGVDINRNYPTGWNSCKGSSNNQSAQDFRGASPGSEPETQAMMGFVNSIKPVFNISYHSYSELVIFPFGCRPLRTPTGQAVESVGTEIAKNINYKPGTAWELLYNADGGDIDWMYAEQQVIPFVIEVNSSWDGGFHPNYKNLRDKTVLRNRPGWMTLMTRLDGPSVQGVVPSITDYHTVRVFKSGEAKEIQTYKINPDGSFYIILVPGKYDLGFEGARSKKVSLDVTSKQTITF